jgi:S1-C subfamily serine protease
MNHSSLHKRYLFIAFVVFLFVPVALMAAELKLQRGGIPLGVFQRVFQIQVGNEKGTSFLIEVDDRQYVITARHIIGGLKDHGSIRLLTDKGWEEIKVNLILPDDPQVDIEAMAIERLLAPAGAIPLESGEPANFMVGQDVYFLGFPFGLSTRHSELPRRLPFVKKAIFSGADSGGGPPVMYLDGYNNPGFSGGPVVFENYFQGDRLEIAGVIAGYRIQPVFVEEALVDDANRSSDGTQKKMVRFVRENSGLIVAFDINAIVKAIRKNPIGIPVKGQ